MASPGPDSGVDPRAGHQRRRLQLRRIRGRIGDVYNAGATEGNLGGTSFGAADAFLSKHDSRGTLLWTRQLGTSGNDRSFGVSADGIDNVYIAGATQGILGGASAGGTDAFLSKYDSLGNLLWTGQLDGAWASEGRGGRVPASLGN